MKLQSMILINRAPFENTTINFIQNGVNLFTGINGTGKTTVISYIVDSFYELARLHYSNSFEGVENKYYRISSSFYSLHTDEPSLVYIRYVNDDGNNIDYIDTRGKWTKESYNTLVQFDNKIPFDKLKSKSTSGSVNKFWSISDRETVESIFVNQLLTYFPAYRYEIPDFLNESYKRRISFSLDIKYSGYLPNPIEVNDDMSNIANWIMDVVIDRYIYEGIHINLFSDINQILTGILNFKTGSKVRIGIGPRNNGAPRISIMNSETNTQIYPNIFAMSSGELALVSLFCELIRQADNIYYDINSISGIVLVDEIEKHLHIQLQKESLPRLIKMFPNIQFIASSHSPFFALGLEDIENTSYRILDFDNSCVTTEPQNNEVFREAYEILIGKNERFKYKYEELQKSINEGTKPIVITEGKTDWKHIKSAMKALKIDDLDIEFLETEDTIGDVLLAKAIRNYAMLPQQRKIIAIFDRDNLQEEVIRKLNLLDCDNGYISLGNNIYAFAIPLVHEELYGKFISIEHYYLREDLLQEDSNGRRLFLGEEFYESGLSRNHKYFTSNSIRKKVEVNGVIDDKVYYADCDPKCDSSIALTKEAFAELITENVNLYPDKVDFSAFTRIFDIIRKIVNIE